jgi:hypothetical protein
MSVPRVLLSALLCVGLMGGGAGAQENPQPTAPVAGVAVGTYPQQVAEHFTSEQGLPTDPAMSVTITGDGGVWAGTGQGVSVFQNGQWNTMSVSSGYSVPLVATRNGELIAIAEGSLYGVEGGSVEELGAAPMGDLQDLAADGDRVYAGSSRGLFRFGGGQFQPVAELNDRLGDNKPWPGRAYSRRGGRGAVRALGRPVAGTRAARGRPELGASGRARRGLRQPGPAVVRKSPGRGSAGIRRLEALHRQGGPALQRRTLP